MEADSQESVEERLKSLGFTTVQVRPVRFRLQLRRYRWWISKTDRLIVSRQLETMREAGLPLMQSLRILEQQHVSAVARRLRAVRTALEAGVAVDDALAVAGDLLRV